MDENNIDQTNKPQPNEPQILINDYGATRDSAVVVDEADRTVLLTEDETIVIEKGPAYNISPKNRPRKVYSGMWGQAEIATVGLAVLAVMAVILIYIFLVIPSQRELERNRADRDRLEQEMVSARKNYGSITTTEARVAELISSVDDFESQYLPVAATGRTALYQRLNSLIAGYGLVNTNGPEFTPLETADQDNSGRPEQERGRDKFRSLFPGVYVTVTLEGPYQNLRRFIREVETGNEFVVISSVELEPSETQNKGNTPSEAQPQQQIQPVGQIAVNPSAPGGSTGYARPGSPVVSYSQTAPVGKPAGPRGKTRGETVSLRVEMAAYFRRPTAAPLNAEAPQAQ